MIVKRVIVITIVERVIIPRVEERVIPKGCSAKPADRLLNFKSFWLSVMVEKGADREQRDKQQFK
jgi:hypothetical protein